MELSSLEYAKLIMWLAITKHNVYLGKTQLQKLLFIFYGRCLAMGVMPFRDDTPKAFPYGPVFPRSFKRDYTCNYDLTQEEKGMFIQTPDILRLVVSVVEEFCHISATRLSEWSHRDNSPWKKAVYRGDKPAWGREISEADIRNYFNREDWKVGL